MPGLSEWLRLPEWLTRKSSPKSEQLPITDHFTFEFDVVNIHSRSQSRPVEDENEWFFGEYGLDTLQDGPVNALGVWLFDKDDLLTATAYLLTYPAMMALDKSIERTDKDKTVLASEGQDFELDTIALHLTGHIVTVLHQPDGSLDKVTIEVEVTTKTPTTR